MKLVPIFLATLSVALLLFFLLSPPSSKDPPPKEGNDIALPQDPNEKTMEAYNLELARIQDLVAQRPFHVMLQPPFIVAGDEPPNIVKKRSERTVQWAVDRLKALYFDKDPDAIITIWLLKDQNSYYKHAKLLFDDVPSTPFGYYSPSDNAMVMNIGTGGGTLVHEIVHPFVAANFPDCPAWFNEGLGSLYEQSSERNGQIIGLTNWRLEGLQAAIRDGIVPSFQDLTATSEFQFYNEDPGTNYAQARYLCYYLQEHGLLTTFYELFSANVKTDPTGYNSLSKVLNISDFSDFQQHWEQWVLTLQFP